MRTRTTLAKAQEIINTRSREYWDEVFPASVMNFQDFRNVEIAGRIYRTTDSARRLIASKFRVPQEYLRRCPVDLQRDNLNHWVGKYGDAPLFLRFDGDRLRAVFTTRYVPIDNSDILNHLIGMNFPSDAEVFLSLSDEIMSLSVPYQQKTFAIHGEQISPGVAITNSEVGLACFSVEAFLLRLVCTNGLITHDAVNIHVRHTKQDALKMFADAIDQVGLYGSDHEHTLTISIDQAVEDPPGTIGKFSSRFGVKPREAELVKEAWEQMPIATMWGVINAYTLAAQRPEISVENSVKLQKTAGMILDLVETEPSVAQHSVMLRHLTLDRR
jgi:hypothetical protein